MLKKDVAVSLSIGKFDEAHSYLSEDVKWNIVNDRVLNGFDKVEEYFKPISKYFDSVTTNFSVDEVIETEEKVVILGTAVFYKNDEKINIIEACDVYFFDGNKVVELKSYCIPLDKEKWEDF